MKVAMILTVVGLAAAAVFTEGMAGNSYLLNPATDDIVQQLPLGGQRLVRSLPNQRVIRSLSSQRLDRSFPERVSRSLSSQRLARSLPGQRIARVWDTMPKERTYRTTVNEQRVLREPISKTMTVLPNEVTRVQRNIETHVPMVHDRKRYHYTVEDVNNQKLVHHFVEPVEENYLGTRKGRSSTGQIQHKLYRDMKFNPATFTEAGGGELIEGGEQPFDGETFGEPCWKVDKDETCAGQPAGTTLRPKADCFAGDDQVDDGECANLPYPEDIVC
jgi:hypothetical protein